MECNINECSNIPEDGEVQCNECKNTSKRLELIWKEKTEELLIDDL